MSKKISKKISKEQKSLLIGLLLGDGTITNHPDFRIMHSEKQKAYIEWKIKIMDEFGIKNGGLKIYKSTSGYNKGQNVLAVRLSTNATIKALRRTVYIPKKTITRRLLNWLNPLGLAIWYMDDGCINVNTSKQRSSIQHTIKIATCVDEPTVEIIIEYFKEVWGIQFRKFKEKELFSIASSTEEDCSKFIEIIKPYIIPEFLYKIRKNFTKEEFIEYQKTQPSKCETF